MGVADDGTLSLPAMTLPPSSYWSEPFRQSFIQMAKALGGETNWTQTEPNAPIAEWEAFDDDCDARTAPTLAWQREHYPVNVEETHLGGVRVAIVTPEGGVSPDNTNRVLIQLRGGSCGRLVGLEEAIPIAHFGRMKVIAVDYRPAPRNPYPASIEDVVAVYQALLEDHDAANIGIFGTSGGGMLTTQALALLDQRKIARPGAAGIFWAGIMDSPYPFGKFGDSELWELGGIPRSDHTVYRRLIRQLASYMDGVAADDPVGYPGSSDEVIRRFPPTLVVTGTRALDLSPAVTSHARLLRLGNDASLYVMEGGWHAASYGTNGSPEEIDVNTYIGRWFAEHLAR